MGFPKGRNGILPLGRKRGFPARSEIKWEKTRSLAAEFLYFVVIFARILIYYYVNCGARSNYASKSVTGSRTIACKTKFFFLRPLTGNLQDDKSWRKL